MGPSLAAKGLGTISYSHETGMLGTLARRPMKIIMKRVLPRKRRPSKNIPKLSYSGQGLVKKCKLQCGKHDQNNYDIGWQ